MMNRRTFLAASAGGAAVLAAGCAGRLGFETQSAWRDPPLVDDRPDAVYYPAVVEGMATYGTTTAGPYEVALAYSYPHRFWQVTGTDLQKTVVEAEDSLHLMASIWDAESKTVVPIDGLSAEVTQDGEFVTQEVIYPMLSQKMGFHYGTNAALSGNGIYTANVSIGGTDVNRLDRFDGQFGDPATATFEFEFDTDELYDIQFRRLGEEAGEPGAVEPMEMMPVGRAPAVESLPGTALGTEASGDAKVPLRALSTEEANGTESAATTTGNATPSSPTSAPGTDAETGATTATSVSSDGASASTASTAADGSTGGSGARVRLAAFPRTSYNRIVLPLMAISTTVERGGETVFEGPLARTLGPELGYHYRSEPLELQSGDTVGLTVGTPPQVARHDGYETALLEMGPMEFTVPDAPID